MRETLLDEVLSRRGGGKAIAEACGVSQAAVSQWKKVPKKHIKGFCGVVERLLKSTPSPEARA